MFIYSFFSLFQGPFVIIFKTAQETKTQTLYDKVVVARENGTEVRVNHRIDSVRTAKAIPFIYSFSGNCAASALFLHSCVYERFIYSQDRSTYFLQQKRQLHRGNI